MVYVARQYFIASSKDVMKCKGDEIQSSIVAAIAGKSMVEDKPLPFAGRGH